MGAHLARCAGRDDVTAARAAARPDIEQVIGGADGLRVVLDDDDGGAERHQAAQIGDQAPRIAWVQANGRLVQHVQRSGEPRAELRGQAQPLHLPARQRRRRTIEAQVAEPDLHQEAHPSQQLHQDRFRDARRVARDVQPFEPLQQARDRARHDFVVVLPIQPRRARNRRQPRAVANRARHVGRRAHFHGFAPTLLRGLRRQHARAFATLAAALLGGEREPARVQLGRREAALGASALQRQKLLFSGGISELYGA